MVPRYATGRIISDTMKKKNLTRSEVVKAAGYKSINKGLRRLDRLLRGENLGEEFFEKLVEVLGIAPADLDAARRDLIEELKHEDEVRKYHRRRHFSPYVYIKPERGIPRSITTIAFIGDDQFKRIRLPAGIPFLTDGEQIALVRDTIGKHYSKTGGSDQMFGRITGYIYRKTYDFSIAFEPDGRIIYATTEDIHEPVPELRIGGRVIKGGLLRQMGAQPLNTAEE